MTESFLNGRITLHCGDCLDVLATLPENSVDSCVTDPPYGLEFMGKEWDKFAPRERKNASVWDGRRQAQNGWEIKAARQSGKGGGGPSYRSSHYKGANRCLICGKRQFSGSPCKCEKPEWVIEHRQEAPSTMHGFQSFNEAWARQVYRVLKPGAHLLAFGGTRTYHRMVCAIEDAGFEIRDCIQWLYGSGFPKSHDVSKGIDRMARRDYVIAAKELGMKIRSDSFGDWTIREHSPSDAWWEKFKAVLTEEQWGAIERKIIGTNANVIRSNTSTSINYLVNGGSENITIPATDAARQWQGWGTALKPSHEDIILAQKPYDLQSLCEIVAHKIMEALCQLPSLAKDAEKSSLLSQSVFGAGFGSAQWSAVQKCNSPDDLFDLMATGQFGSGTPSSLNTAVSWLLTLDAALKLQSTFTTETEISLTTDLKILNYLLSVNTQDCIIKAATQQSGTASNVLPVVAIFNAVAARVNCIHELSVLDPAILKVSVGGFAPNCEPIVLARKPLSEKTVAANVLKWGTGAINVDGCRVEGAFKSGWSESGSRASENNCMSGPNYARDPKPDNAQGRWPANVIHDGSDEVVGAFPESGGGTAKEAGTGNGTSIFAGTGRTGFTIGDEGSAARFFYTAKADADDRLGSKHPTVKPLDLMQYLVRLVTPKGGTVLDPFAGSGTTGEAAWREHMKAILIEREAEYQTDLRRRMELCLSGPDERQRESIKAKLKDKPADHGPLFGGIA